MFDLKLKALVRKGTQSLSTKFDANRPIGGAINRETSSNLLEDKQETFISAEVLG